MSNHKYKVFFTITFLYYIEEKKVVTKFFKSDVDIDSLTLKEPLNNSSIYKAWKNYALKVNLNDLNPPEKFIEANVSEKKLVTHRIINLINLTEVF
jgi:hypothetical protein